ncbi:hypothetical protein AK830_g6257, partial [Neonectria ditissima]
MTTTNNPPGTPPTSSGSHPTSSGDPTISQTQDRQPESQTLPLNPPFNYNLNPPSEHDDALAEEAELNLRIKNLQASQRISRKRHWLELIDAGITPDFDPDREPQPAKQTRHEHDANTQHTPDYNIGKLILKTPRYSAKSWTELRIYLTDLDSRFLLHPSSFHTDLPKVLLASSCLEGSVKLRWTSFLNNDRRGQINEITWNDYLTWVKGTIDDDSTRCLETTAKLARCYMKPGQTVRNFLDYYEALEAELPDRLPDSYRVCSAIHRLTPALRTQVVSREIPSTWQKFVSSVTQAETILGRPNSSNSNTHSSPASSTTPNTNPTNTPAAPQAPRRPYGGIVTCYKCGEEGHISTKCFKPDCETCKSNRHTTNRHLASHDPATPATAPNNVRFAS